MGPSLAVLIPTYGRVAHVSALLRALAAECGAAPGARVSVLVSDNASADGTAGAVGALQAELPALDLALHVQAENVGPVRNIRWLFEHAPEADYLWLMCDDDLPVPGAVGQVLGALAERPVRLLHLPHTFERDGRVQASSRCPERPESFAGSRELSLAYHHWVTFGSACVLQRDALQHACRELPTANLWAPHIWYLNAARDGECLVLDRPLVRGGMDITWSASRAAVLTDGVIASFDDGLDRVMDAADFARYLDDFYPDVGREGWAEVPLERQLDALRRFPLSRELRRAAFEHALAQGRPDVIAELDVIARAAGAADAAAALVAEGESSFAAGDPFAAVQHFHAALGELPTLVEAWSNLGVALHATGDPAAIRALDIALALDPDDEDAQYNRAQLAA